MGSASAAQDGMLAGGSQAVSAAIRLPRPAPAATPQHGLQGPSAAATPRAGTCALLLGMQNLDTAGSAGGGLTARRVHRQKRGQQPRHRRRPLSSGRLCNRRLPQSAAVLGRQDLWPGHRVRHQGCALDTPLTPWIKVALGACSSGEAGPNCVLHSSRCSHGQPMLCHGW